MPKRLLSVLFYIVLTAQAFSQECALIEIMYNDSQPLGRATLVEIKGNKGYAVTAYHVVKENPQLNSSNFKIRYRHDKVVLSGARVIDSKAIKNLDIALIEVPLSPTCVPVEVGDISEEDIFLYDINWEVKKPRLSLVQSTHYYFDFTPYQGESGGPVFANGKLVGIVSGGWFWTEQDIFDTVQRRKTWPLRTPKITKDFLIIPDNSTPSNILFVR
jgi:hypothetical protein